MTKTELFNTIETERKRLEDTLAGLGPEQMTRPGAMGEWSVKDILGHIAVWEARLVTILYTVERGVAPKMFHGQAEVDRLNGESYAEQRDRLLDRVLSDFHAVHAQLLKRLEVVRERDLTDPQRFKWMEGDPLEKLVAADTFGHYAEHLPAIEAWRAKISS